MSVLTDIIIRDRRGGLRKEDDLDSVKMYNLLAGMKNTLDKCMEFANVRDFTCGGMRCHDTIYVKELGRDIYVELKSSYEGCITDDKERKSRRLFFLMSGCGDPECVEGIIAKYGNLYEDKEHKLDTILS